MKHEFSCGTPSKLLFFSRPGGTKLHSEASIRIGGAEVLQGGGILSTVLGSCVGLLLVHRPSQTAGMSHMLLPHGAADLPSPGKYVNLAVPRLLSEVMATAKCSVDQIDAYAAGGATMYPTSIHPTIGQKNIDALMTVSHRLEIQILETDFGGSNARRLSYCLDTDVRSIWKIERGTKADD